MLIVVLNIAIAFLVRYMIYKFGSREERLINGFTHSEYSFASVSGPEKDRMFFFLSSVRASYFQCWLISLTIFMA